MARKVDINQVQVDMLKAANGAAEGTQQQAAEWQPKSAYFKWVMKLGKEKKEQEDLSERCVDCQRLYKGGRDNMLHVCAVCGAGYQDYQTHTVENCRSRLEINKQYAERLLADSFAKLSSPALQIKATPLQETDNTHTNGALAAAS